MNLKLVQMEVQEH